MPLTINEFTNTLSRISAGVTGEAAVSQFNTPLSQIETSLNTLASRIADLNNKSAIVQKYVPCASNVFVGALVYYNPEVGHTRYELALASLLPTPGAQGESIEAPCARVEGIILSRDDTVDGSDNVFCTMLRGGYWEDADVISGCLGDTATAGMYYLSPTSAGHAISDPGGHLRQGSLMYHGNGAFSMSLFYLAHDNHFHGSCELTGTWEPANNPPPNITAPLGSYWWYNGPADSNMNDIGELSEETTAVFYNGVLQTSNDDFIISEGYLWYNVENSVPEPGTVTIFNSYPFAYGSPVVRSVETTNDALTIKSVNGIVKLTAQDFISGSVAKNALAVSAISGNTILFTPVVTGVKAGPGINVNAQVNGSVIVSASKLIGTTIDAYSVNHIGTNQTSDGCFLYFTFPKGRNSSLVMFLPVTDVPSTTILRPTIWGWCASPSAVLNVSLYWASTPARNTDIEIRPTAIPTTPIYIGTLTFSGNPGFLSYAETVSTANIQGEGLLAAKLAISSTPTDDIKLLRLGFLLNTVEASESDAVKTNVTSIKAVTNKLTAYENINQYDLVKITNNGLMRCQSDAILDCNTCVGIALESGTSGNDIEYLITGVIQDTTFTLAAGGAVYIGTNSRMTQTDPSTDSTALFIQRIGTALTTAAVQISIEPGILKTTEE